MLQVLGLIAVASLIMVSLNLCMKLYTSRRTNGHVRLEGDELLVVTAQEMTPAVEAVLGSIRNGVYSQRSQSQYLLLSENAVPPRLAKPSAHYPNSKIAIWVLLVVNLLATTPLAQASSSDQHIPTPRLGQDPSKPALINAYELPTPLPGHGPHPVDYRINCRWPMDDTKHHCGLLEVPLDWHNLTRGFGRVHYARYPASPEVVRKGTIFIDTGAPFAMSGAWTPQEWLSMRGNALHNRTHGEYDIVAWDARGKGTHNLTIPGPLRCFKDAAERDRFHARLGHEWPVRRWQDSQQLGEQWGADDIEKWHFTQSKVVEHCLAQQDPEMLRNMGVASTTRDLIAMADAFDGPGSPVNFWGMSYGSLIGTHLLQMFPEKSYTSQRAGRVILDDPADLMAYTVLPSYQTWKEDISHANKTFAEYAKRCASDGIHGCQLSSYGGTDSEIIGDYMRVNFGLARASLLGRRNTVKEDLLNPYFEDLFKTIVQHGTNASETSYNVTNAISSLSAVYAYADESLGLGVMPIFCGDNLRDHDPAKASQHARAMIKSLTKDRGSVPVLTNDAFPAMHYMCHLWPVRAAERYPIFGSSADDYMQPPPPVRNFLVLQGFMSPLAAPKFLDQVTYGFQPGRAAHDVRNVIQLEFGTPIFSHSRCASRIIVDYLYNGTLPEHATTTCHGNEVESASDVLDDATGLQIFRALVAHTWHKFATAYQTSSRGDALLRLGQLLGFVATFISVRKTLLRRAAHQNVAVGGDREAQGDIGWKDEREDSTQAAQQ
ncbi:uncharacterized protein TRAVEDRAFT_66763 [Trametes versicolor FP-101664 SS1]|uniref:uncharacterized protein n=1 Tax=Trametes versicolor (strain FP-101664) TaxID=717944 RepID=UPI00046223BC|nr:uncharacterized protein TRAVEDRAFT_66763 [Trametes versicolor FP-101664 SS1]EIW54340.1 hypothetical protein TRAVEDRAFT_66763 [Trametes versicolor FP-101664 SS1]